MTPDERAEIEALLKRWRELAADAYYRVKGGHALAHYYGGLQFGLELAADELAALLPQAPGQQQDGDEQQHPRIETEHGKIMAKLNVERSKALAGNVRPEQKACWNNAYYVLTTELPYGLYVEGFAIEKGGFVFEHGWLEEGDDIIDPTLYHNPPARYVPGLRFTQQQIQAEWKKHGNDDELPITRDHQTQYPDYLDAWAIAFDMSGVPGSAELARLHRTAAAKAREELAARQPPEP